MAGPPTPLRVAVVNDFEIVIAGVAAALVPFAERIAVVELDSQMPVVSDVDVILYDTFGQVQGDGVDLEDLVRGGDAHVVIFSWNVQPELVERSLAAGASGYLSKQLTAAAIVDALERVVAGERVRPDVVRVASDKVKGSWPGQDAGLSAREAEVIALISAGLSNQEIADLTYLSINSVKTYVRTAYRKIGVSRRSQAVIWGLANGFEPDRLRLIAAKLG